MNNYQCEGCHEIVQFAGEPRSTPCLRGGHHHWKNLGPAGDHSVQCRRCKVLIKAAASPWTAACPSGGLHDWVKLTRFASESAWRRHS